ncbi:hypothetical protein FKM82_004121 [Ascaphus truei]
MASYHYFLGRCLNLEYTARKYEIMQQEIRPLLAVDIIEQLHKQFATLSGGRGADGAPIITFPEYPSFSEIPDEDFLNVVTYLTSIPSLEAASIGFIIIIDRRRDKWRSVKASLTRIAGAFPGNLQLVFVLRPSRFIQRTIADIGIKLYRDDFKMKVPIIMVNSVSDLHGYIDKSQLTQELGGSMEYSNSQWIHHRTAIESFAQVVKTTAQSLQTFGTSLAETELPNDKLCTEELLLSHTEQQNKLKEDLRLAVQQGATLLSRIKKPASKDSSQQLNQDEVENMATVERLLAQLDETEKAFEEFWTRHHLKLEQCLQLRHFEHDFRELKLALDVLMEMQSAFTDIGDRVSRVVQLLKELKQLEEKGQGGRLLALYMAGTSGVSSQAESEVEHTSHSTEYEHRDKWWAPLFTGYHEGMDRTRFLLIKNNIVDYWWAAGAFTPQEVEDEIDHRYRDIEQKLIQPKGPSILYDEIAPIEPEFWVLPSRACHPTPRRASDVPCTPPKSLSEADLSRKKNNRKTKGGIKIEVMHEASQGGTSRSLGMSESEENLSSRKSHIINELIDTERVYVEELQSIIEKEDLQVYEKYCQNKPKSEALWRQCGESLFFQECQRKLDHKLSLDAYLLKPVQRITKYQLLLKEMLKCSKNSEGTAELEEALATVLDIIKSVNDSMHQIAITGYEGDLNDLGKLLMQGSFNVWTDHKKGHNKVKDLARFKPMQRHLFLYAKTLLFCKKREDNGEGHEKSPSYSFKHALKMSSVGITENVKGDNKKFEVWYNGREEVYIIQASTIELKSLWVSEIRKVLTGQLEACREASQLHQRITESVYHAPMNSSCITRYNKTSVNSQNKSECTSIDASNYKNRSSSTRQKKADIPASHNLERSALARKRFTLQGLSNRRGSPKGKMSSACKLRRPVRHGSLGLDVRTKRHEIKSDPTPLGFEGWPRHMSSLETYEDFSTIPSSNDELSNSSDVEEETTDIKGSNLFRVDGCFETCSPATFTLQPGDVVEFEQGGENGQWLVTELVSKRKAWVPSSLLIPAKGDIENICQKDNIAGNYPT